MAEKVIVLEGLPASGKTTIADTLVREYGLTKINESLGRFNLHSHVKDQRTVFLEMVERYQMTYEVKGPVLIDRGYPTILAWDHTAKQLGKANNLAEKELWVKEALDEGLLFEPDVYIYLDSDPVLSLERRPRGPHRGDVWSEPEGMLHYVDYCDAFFQQPGINVLHIDARLALNGALAAVRGVC